MRVAMSLAPSTGDSHFRTPFPHHCGKSWRPSPWAQAIQSIETTLAVLRTGERQREWPIQLQQRISWQAGNHKRWKRQLSCHNQLGVAWQGQHMFIPEEILAFDMWKRSLCPLWRCAPIRLVNIVKPCAKRNPRSKIRQTLILAGYDCNSQTQKWFEEHRWIIAVLGQAGSKSSDLLPKDCLSKRTVPGLRMLKYTWLILAALAGGQQLLHSLCGGKKSIHATLSNTCEMYYVYSI